MALSTKSGEDESLNDSWVDIDTLEFSDCNHHSAPLPTLNNSVKPEREQWEEVGSSDCNSDSNRRITPVPSIINSGKLERLLWEAQRESKASSVASPISSTRDSPSSPCSPKSAHSPHCSTQSPCSPKSQEPHNLLIEDANDPYFGEFKAVDIYLSRGQGSTDWIWDWSCHSDQSKVNSFRERKLQDEKYNRGSLSLRNSRIVKSGLFSSEVLSVLFVTNVLSILVGAGLGLFISKQVGTSFFHLAKQ